MTYTLPKHWQIVTTDDVCVLMTNGFVGKATSHYTDKENGILYIQGFNVKKNGFDLTGIKKVTPEFHSKNKKSQLKALDLLTIQTGEIGLTTIVPKNLEGANCHALIISRFKPEKAWAPYMAQLYNSPVFAAKIKKIETGSTMKHINVGHLKKVTFPLPPLPEQHRIVTILEAWDEMIKKLKKKIELKQKIKEELAQRLLTGKRRLPDFSQKWQIVKMSDIFERITRIAKNSDSLTSYSISSKIGFETQEEKYSRVMSGDSLKRYIHIRKGEFAYNKGNSITYPHGCVYLFQMNEGLVPFVYICFGNKGNVSSDFYKHYFLQSLLDKELKAQITSGVRGNGLLNISSKSFFSCKVFCPPIEEQNAIARVLETADKEIYGLEKKLVSLQKQKDYLLNNIITGKIRISESISISKS